jgi:hypothetical protein
MKIDTTPNKTDAGDDKSPRLIRNVGHKARRTKEVR